MADSEHSGGTDAANAWRGPLELAFKEPFLLSLMIGSGLLSLASFYTTFTGLDHFMPHIGITICVVFAVQALLLVTSWRIGYIFAGGEPLPAFTTAVFLICLSASVFFSWSALFESINGSADQERTRQIRMQSAVEGVVSDLQARLHEKRRAAAKDMAGGDAYAAWRADVEKVIAAAIAGKAAIEAARDAEAARLAERVKALEAERADALRKKTAEGARASMLEGEVERAKGERPALVERITRLRAEQSALSEKVALKQAEMDAEENGAQRGRGKKWEALRVQRDALIAQLSAKKTLLAEAQTELAALDESIAKLGGEAMAAASAADGGVGGLDARLDALKSALAASGGGARGFDAEIAALRREILAFETGFDLGNFTAAAGRCERLLERVAAEPSLSVGALSCDVAPLTADVNALRAAMDAEAKLKAQCAPGGAVNIAELGFEAASAFGRECAVTAGLPAATVEKVLAGVSRVKLEEDPDASPFIRTMNAVRSGDKLAYLALVIALAIDLMVLFCGMIGALRDPEREAARDRKVRGRRARKVENSLRVDLDVGPDAPPEVRTAHAILASLVAGRFKTGLLGRRYNASVSLDSLLDPRRAGEVRQFLVGMSIDGLAAACPRAPGRVFYLTDALIEDLQHRVANPAPPRPRPIAAVEPNGAPAPAPVAAPAREALGWSSGPLAPEDRRFQERMRAHFSPVLSAPEAAAPKRPGNDDLRAAPGLAAARQRALGD